LSAIAEAYIAISFSLWLLSQPFFAQQQCSQLLIKLQSFPNKTSDKSTRLPESQVAHTRRSLSLLPNFAYKVWATKKSTQTADKTCPANDHNRL
jgi:hypothetical protein